MAIYPTPEQIQTLLADPDDRPVVMLNLLRFKPPPKAAPRADKPPTSAMPSRREVVEGEGAPLVGQGRFARDREADAAAFDVVGTSNIRRAGSSSRS
jgi:hypothetical protein